MDKDSMKKTTNRAFSTSDFFTRLCVSLGIKPTKRQASKYRLGKGSAYARRLEVKDKME